MISRYRVEATVGIFVLIAVICVGYLTIQLGQLRIIGKGYYELEARFSTVSGLQAGNDVRLAGVKIGQVKSIRLQENLQAAMVSMKLREDVKLTDDSIASIKTSGLIGDRYISISPGGSGIYLKPGDTIIDTQPPIDFEEIMSKYVFGDVNK
jgi:phospholipid/cholesterol/gamma-HCH transport system substrate-binding protein